MKNKGEKNYFFLRLNENWKNFKLGKLFRFKNGKRPQIISGGSIPVYGANGLMGYTNKSLIKEDRILIIGRVGASGEVHLATGEIWVSDNAIYGEAIDKSKIDILFIFYLLRFKDLTRLATKSTHPIINQTILNNLSIPLPPLPEQKKIAEILSTVDEAIEVTDKEIEKAERLKRGLMQELLTKGIGHTKFKKTEVGTIPEEWEVMKLRNVTEKFISGGTPSTKEKRFWDGRIPWISSSHMEGLYILTGEKFISKEGLKESATNMIPSGNVIIATRVGIGKVAVNKIDVAINQDLTGLILKKQKIVPDFLVWYLLSPISQLKLKSITRGTTIKGIARVDLQRVKLPLPPLPEQQKIAEILSSVDDFIESLRARREKLVKLKQGLMEDLLTGKRRVKVDDEEA